MRCSTIWEVSDRLRNRNKLRRYAHACVDPYVAHFTAFLCPFLNYASASDTLLAISSGTLCLYCTIWPTISIFLYVIDIAFW